MQTVLEDAAHDILVDFGDMDAQYKPNGKPSVSLPMIVSYNSAIEGDNFQTISRATTVEFLRSSKKRPKRGDTIFADDADFVVERTLSTDSIWVKLIVK
ncbi:MAG: hypothetical protein PF440_06315 [Thiomicrorhabdus sp.]|jgi:hypothetical protein|nr:hypothetical protein [Thiomicrorhabdus sp.]